MQQVITNKETLEQYVKAKYWILEETPKWYKNHAAVAKGKALSNKTHIPVEFIIEGYFPPSFR